MVPLHEERGGRSSTHFTRASRTSPPPLLLSLSSSFFPSPQVDKNSTLCTPSSLSWKNAASLCFLCSLRSVPSFFFSRTPESLAGSESAAACGNETWQEEKACDLQRWECVGFGRQAGTARAALERLATEGDSPARALLASCCGRREAARDEDERESVSDRDSRAMYLCLCVSVRTFPPSFHRCLLNPRAPFLFLPLKNPPFCLSSFPRRAPRGVSGPESQPSQSLRRPES